MLAKRRYCRSSNLRLSFSASLRQPLNVLTGMPSCFLTRKTSPSHVLFGEKPGDIRMPGDFSLYEGVVDLEAGKAQPLGLLPDLLGIHAGGDHHLPAAFRIQAHLGRHELV